MSVWFQKYRRQLNWITAVWREEMQRTNILNKQSKFDIMKQGLHCVAFVFVFIVWTMWRLYSQFLPKMHTQTHSNFCLWVDDGRRTTKMFVTRHHISIHVRMRRQYRLRVSAFHFETSITRAHYSAAQQENQSRTSTLRKRFFELTICVIRW